MSNVAIITDSTANLPEALVAQHEIHVAPQVLIWNGDTYQDGVEIQAKEFYERLKAAKTMPTTSQATPATFAAMFKPLVEQDRPILAIVISEKLSGTLDSALQAREMFPGAAIEIFDSGTAAAALGFQALAAARLAQAGASPAECLAEARRARLNTGVIFAVDTLEFLHRGGRIGGAGRYLGTALNIKPILEVQHGKVEAVERVRTRAKSLQRLVELAVERIGDRRPIHLAVLHANALDDAQQLYELTRSSIDTVEHIFTELTPVIGTHTGPGTVGLAYLAGM